MDKNGVALRDDKAALRAQQSAVRVLCVDPRGRILLLRWTDPDGSVYWEPPGGVIGAGESTVEAAGRGLTQHTGVTARAITGRHILVRRDLTWFGEPITVIEPFYLARIGETPVIDHSRPAFARRATGSRCTDHKWLWPDELSTMQDHVEPADLRSVTLRLGIGTSWTTRTRL
jgi:8-oxo-dGTP pyrophosphatase MutT (NUDIX family)